MMNMTTHVLHLWIIFFIHQSFYVISTKSSLHHEDVWFYGPLNFKEQNSKKKLICFLNVLSPWMNISMVNSLHNIFYVFFISMLIISHHPHESNIKTSHTSRKYFINALIITKRKALDMKKIICMTLMWHFPKCSLQYNKKSVIKKILVGNKAFMQEEA